MTTKTGSVFDRTDFDRLTPDDLAAPLGPKLAAATTDGRVDRNKLARILTTDAKVAAMFDGVAAAVGIAPIATPDAGLPRERLAAAAAAY